jgi:hypothetical protein
LSPSRRSRLGWQPSRFLTNRAEAERAYALPEQLGGVNAAAAELGTTWPSLRKAFTRRGLGMPTPTPKRSGGGPSSRLTGAVGSRLPGLARVFVALTRRPSAGERPAAELHEWVRREVDSASRYELSIRLSAHTRGLTGWS